MPTTYNGLFTSNGDGTGTWSLANGESGSFSVIDYTVNSDSSVSYRQRFYRANGSTFGDVLGIVRGNQASNSGRYSGTWTLTEDNGTYTFNNYRDGTLISSGSFQSLSSSPFGLLLDQSYSVGSIIESILGTSTSSSALSIDVSDKTLSVSASSWTGSIKINYAAKASNNGDTLNAKQIEFNSSGAQGSVIQGGSRNDVLLGKAGWDIIDGGAGNDLIRGGNGRDILIGGIGADEIHGDFGWNTYKSEKDGFADLVAIKSDQSLVNWLYGKAGNNADGSKCDIIEGLDSIDRIRIIGCDTKDLTFTNATAKGLSGVGIYAKGSLEALYTGNDLSIAQIQAMTTGDGSAAAMANQITSYGWTTNPSAAEFTPTTTTDAITGQQLIFSDLGTIESDKVYGKENYRWLQPIVNNLPFTQRDMDLLTEFKIEFEFNDEYIVATGVIRGDTRQTLSQYMGSDWTARLALKGRFEYSQGLLNSASIETAAVQLVSQSAPFSIGSANVAILDPQLTSKKSITVTNPASWDNVLGTLTRPSEFSFINGYTPLNSEKEFTTKEMLKQFGGGRFFYNGWETNPFNSNLL